MQGGLDFAEFDAVATSFDLMVAAAKIGQPPVGAARRLTAYADGVVTTAVLWSVNGLVGGNAIVRHTWDSVSESGGKSNASHLGVLQVWAKQDGTWKLLARQAFKA